MDAEPKTKSHCVRFLTLEHLYYTLAESSPR